MDINELLEQYDQLVAGIEVVQTKNDYKCLMEEDLRRFDRYMAMIKDGQNRNVTVLSSFPNSMLIATKECKEEDEQIELPNNNEKIVNTLDIYNMLEKNNIYSDSLSDMTSDTPNECINCGSVDTIVENATCGAKVCSECGVKNEQMIDDGPEWRNYNDSSRAETNGRCGMPSNIFFPKESQGTVIIRCGNNRLVTKQTWNNSEHKERSLRKVFNRMDGVCKNIGKNNCTGASLRVKISDTAKKIYKCIHDCTHKTGEKKGKTIITRANNRTNIIAACVLRACYINNYPRSKTEVAGYFGIKKTDVTSGNNQLDKLLKNSDKYQEINELTNQDTVIDYIKCNQRILRIPDEELELAIRIARNSCRMKLASNHNAESLAAGVILHMVDQTTVILKKSEIAKTFCTSEATITKTYQNLMPFMEALVDDEITSYIIERLG
jgi:transcription initiation factor TFIIIB Brf1 subunit/transcription initiation factor TFIIB